MYAQLFHLHNHLLVLLNNFHMEIGQQRWWHGKAQRRGSQQWSTEMTKLHFKCDCWHKCHSKPTLCDLNSTFDNLPTCTMFTLQAISVYAVYYAKMERNNWSLQLKKAQVCFLSPNPRATQIRLLWFGCWWMRMIICIEIKPPQRCCFNKRQQRAHSSNLWKCLSPSSE